MEFAAESENWDYSVRRQDFIMNEPLQYPRPRIMKRDTSTVGKRMITLSGLPPNSPIKAIVRVLNKYYAGPPSNAITFTTPEGGMRLVML